MHWCPLKGSGQGRPSPIPGTEWGNQRETQQPYLGTSSSGAGSVFMAECRREAQDCLHHVGHEKHRMCLKVRPAPPSLCQQEIGSANPRTQPSLPCQKEAVAGARTASARCHPALLSWTARRHTLQLNIRLISTYQRSSAPRLENVHKPHTVQVGSGCRDGDHCPNVKHANQERGE